MMLSIRSLQMMVNFAGVGGGFKLGQLLGVDPSTAVWLPASYRSAFASPPISLQLDEC
jgi:hypothetical protein